MEYKKYIEMLTLIEEEEVGYLSNIILDTVSVKKTEFDDLSNNRFFLESKLNLLKFFENKLTDFLKNKNDLERNK